MGERAYDVLREQLGEKIIGLDRNPERVLAQRESGRNVLLGDSTDPDLYERIEAQGRVRLLLLTMANHQEKLTTVRLLGQVGRTAVLAALAQHEDEVRELQEAGVQAAFDLSSEAGEGFARHALEVAARSPHMEAPKNGQH